MGAVTVHLPSPDDPGLAPVWDNYIVAQAVQASLGLIPKHAVAIGVAVAGTEVRLCFQLTEVTSDDLADMGDIASELETLVGEEVQVELAHEMRSAPDVSPLTGVRWIFIARP
jgi:hypothetical protein